MLSSIKIPFSCLAAISAMCINTYAKESTTDQSHLSRSTAEFTFELAPLLENEDCTLFSPFTLFSSLALLHQGAREESAAQIAKALHLPLSKDFFLKDMKSEMDNLKAKQSLALWLDKDTFLLTSFRYLASDTFDANVVSIDFSNSALSASMINKWTQNQMNSDLFSILNEQDLSSSTRMVSTSTYKIENRWKFPFDEKNTKVEPFFIENSSIPTKMMDVTAFLPIAENEKYKMVALPLEPEEKNSSTQLFILIITKQPLKPKDLFDQQGAFTFTSMVRNLDERYIHLKMPRINASCTLRLKNSLMQMGMKNPFTEKANFSGIDGLKDLILSEAIHKSLLKVDESGVCSTATSNTSMTPKEVKEIPIDVFANTPFIYAIVQRETGLIHLFGQYKQPRRVEP